MNKKAALLLAGIVTFTGLTGCSGKEKVNPESKVITVASSPVPHGEILEEAKKLLKEKGIELKITIFDDYVIPNQVVESGEMDVNFFQHKPYMDNYNKEKGSSLISMGSIHYEPFGIYKGIRKDLKELVKKDIIAIPNDATNEGRALLLLQDNGLIKLKEGTGLKATVKDIVENKLELSFIELEASQISKRKDEVALMVINGNYALTAGFSLQKDSLAIEKADSEAVITYANILTTKKGRENDEKLKILLEVLKTEKMQNFINNKYKGSVIPSK